MNEAHNAESRILKIRKLIATVYHQSKYTKVRVTNPQTAVKHIDFVLKCLHIKNLCFNELCNMLIEEDRGCYVELFKILFSIQQMFLKSGLVELYLKVQRDSEKEPVGQDNKQRADFHQFLGQANAQDLPNGAQDKQGTLLKGMHRGMLSRSFEKMMDQKFSTKGLETRKDERQYVFSEEKENSNSYFAYRGKNRDQDEQLEKDAAKLLDDLDNGRFERTELVKDPLLLLRVNEKLAETVLSSHMKLDKRVDKWIEKLGRVSYDKDNFKEMIETLQAVVDRCGESGNDVLAEDRTQQNGRFGDFKLDELERHVQEKFGDGFRLLFRKLLRLMQEKRTYNVDDKLVQTELTAIGIDEEQKRTQSEKRKFEDEVAVLQSQIIEHENTIDYLRALNANVEAKYADSGKQLDNAREEYDKLEKDSLSIFAECKALKSQVDFLQKGQAKLNSNFRAFGRRLVELQSHLNSLIFVKKSTEDEERRLESKIDSSDDLKYFTNALEHFTNFTKNYVAKTANNAHSASSTPRELERFHAMGKKRDQHFSSEVFSPLIKKLSLLTAIKRNSKDPEELQSRGAELRRLFRDMLENDSIDLDAFLGKVLEETNLSEVEAELNETILSDRLQVSSTNIKETKGSNGRSTKATRNTRGLNKITELDHVEDSQRSETFDYDANSETGFNQRQEEVSSPSGFQKSEGKRHKAKNAVNKDFQRSHVPKKPPRPAEDKSGRQDARMVKGNSQIAKVETISNVNQKAPNHNSTTANADKEARMPDNSQLKSKKPANIRIRKSHKTLTKSITGPLNEVLQSNVYDNSKAEDKQSHMRGMTLDNSAVSHVTEANSVVIRNINAKLISRGTSVKPYTAERWQQTSPRNDTRLGGVQPIKRRTVRSGVNMQPVAINDPMHIFSNIKRRLLYEIEDLWESQLVQFASKPTYDSALNTVLELSNGQLVQLFYYLKHHINAGAIVSNPTEAGSRRQTKLDQILPQRAGRKVTQGERRSSEMRRTMRYIRARANMEEGSRSFSEKRKDSVSFSKERRSRYNTAHHSADKNKRSMSYRPKQPVNNMNFNITAERMYIQDRRKNQEGDETIRSNKRSVNKDGDVRKTRKELRPEVDDKDLRKVNEVIYCTGVSSSNKRSLSRKRANGPNLTLNSQYYGEPDYNALHRREFGQMSSSAIHSTLVAKLKDTLSVKQLALDSTHAELQHNVNRLIRKFSDIHGSCYPVCKHLVYFEKHIKEYISRKLGREPMVLPVVRFDQVELPAKKTFLPFK